MSTSGRSLAALVAVGALAVAVRVVGLGQYPQVHPDEGFWACGPRNYALFGDGLMDGRLHPFLSPATFVLLSGYFKLVGPDLVSARAFSVGWGLLTCLLVAHLARAHAGRRAW